MSAVAKFAPSHFGGGWIIPQNEEATEICVNFFNGEEPRAIPLWGETGYVVEPQDVAETVEGLRLDGCEVEL